MQATIFLFYYIYFPPNASIFLVSYINFHIYHPQQPSISLFFSFSLSQFQMTPNRSQFHRYSLMIRPNCMLSLFSNLELCDDVLINKEHHFLEWHAITKPSPSSLEVSKFASDSNTSAWVNARVYSYLELKFALLLEKLGVKNNLIWTIRY